MKPSWQPVGRPVKTAGEGGAGGAEVEVQGEVVDDLDGLELAQLGGGEGRGGAELEVELDGFGVEGGAVVEGDAGAQGEGPEGEVLVGDHGLGEVGPGVAVGVVGHEGVEDRRGHLEAGRGEAVLGRVQPVGLRREAHDEVAAGLGRPGRRGGGGPAVRAASRPVVAAAATPARARHERRDEYGEEEGAPRGA
ncbi:MAG: hypothetical protein M5U14_02785 [Acidimicrobiia bacterium]|nr:hypothetical protein [Acidimicrobiia bacterium]